MKPFIFSLPIKLSLLLLCVCSLAYAQNLPTQLYSTGIYAEDQIDILVSAPTGEEVLYAAPGGIISQSMEGAWAFPNWQKASIAAPSSPYLGFRNSFPEDSLNPLYWDGALDPNLQFYTPMDTDPIGDNLYSPLGLDIVATKISFSADRIYFAIYNASGSFPVSSGLTYYSYMPILANPDASGDDNPIAFGLMYTVNVAGIISPGLYKLSGTGMDGLMRMGNIQQAVEGSALLISCALADLLADADFSSWFNVNNPRISTVTTTSRITLVNGVQQSDNTTGMELLLLPRTIPLVNNSAPLLSAAGFTPNPENSIAAQITYFDNDANFPRLASVSIDGGEEYPLVPVELGVPGFTAPVVFHNANLPVQANWSELRFRFSHGDDFVYQTLHNSSAAQDLVQNARFGFTVFPNPSSKSILLKSESPESAEYSIFNLRGQKIGSYIQADANSEVAIDISAYAPGLYFVRSSGKKTSVQRFVKLK
ncbi:MAG: T9SS type A sorting domain-containing protein [Candidatus Cloacimonas sp.]|jgi:hypothetical protein|nr:T9SS type A sorting domain-containing protein [Candidatus Cloacimonas sp.]